MSDSIRVTLTMGSIRMTVRVAHDQYDQPISEQVAKSKGIAAIRIVNEANGNVQDTVTYAKAREMISAAAARGATIEGIL